ncbi:PAS domain S-box protein [Chloroflexota bacterium]
MAKSDKSASRVVAEIGTIREHLVELEKLVSCGNIREQMQADLFYHSPAAYYVVEDDVFRSVSPKLREITGYSEDELIGRSPLSLVAPEDSQQVRERVIKLLKKKQLFVHQYRIITKDAKVKWVIESASPMFENGRQAFIANLIDITGLKQAEESSRSSEEKYRDLCENASDMIQCTTPSGSIIYTNRAWRQAMGYSDGEINNLSLFEIVPYDYKDYWIEILHQAISKEQPYNVDSILVNSSGTRINVQGTINCRFVDGKPVYTRGILRNVTRLKQEMADREVALEQISEIENRLAQSKREFEEFIHVASHDLREPLRKISSFGALIQESLEGKLDDDQRENLDFMTDGAERLQSMINDLLTYSRITTKAKPFQPVDLNQVVENLRHFELASAFEETKGEILIPNPLVVVYGDPSQIHQLLQNLIANSLKFHRDDIPPRISINSYPTQGNKVRIAVQDNGIGIDPKYHEQVFVMFKRLHPPTLYKGTGIGLAICKRIVQRHGGEIGVESIPEDGTVIWFTLPRFNHSS